MTSKDGTNFDFATAEQLSSVLTQLSEKINWMAWTRATQGANYLDAMGNSWQGAKRGRFDHESAGHQAALAALAAQAQTLRGQVDHAITQALAARQAGRH